MTVVAALVLMGTTFTTKAASLLKSSDVSISQDNDNSFVLKHASQIFGNSEMSLTGHGSHSSHVSHASHASHSSHYSSR
jgi:hypothetical protein